MMRIGDRRFLFAWQAIRAATQPGAEACAWQVGDVDWRRSRSSMATADYVVNLDVHRLERRSRGGAWSVLVVSEAWWDGCHNLLRSQLWATHLSGDRNLIAAWMNDQAEVLAPGHDANAVPAD
jgi:hypothetical protein